MAAKFLWRKQATTGWLKTHEVALNERTGGTHAVIERPDRSRLQLEAFCAKRRTGETLVRNFGGSIVRLTSDWLIRSVQSHRTKPLRIGKRLVVWGDTDPKSQLPVLVIPASTAFGTGEHATTAMSLRLLESVTWGRENGWRMLDAGTGSGILALAARRFGAGEVLAIDHDPVAIKTAKWNARENKIRGIEFRVGDVNRPIARRFDIITANLFSELLIAVLPRFRRGLRRGGQLILSGVLRGQEPALRRALRAIGFRVELVRRRGKWIALLANSSSRSYS